MDILFLTPGLPWPVDTGGRQRRFYLLRELSKRHRITLIVLDRRAQGSTLEEARRALPFVYRLESAPQFAPQVRVQITERKWGKLKIWTQNALSVLRSPNPAVVQRWNTAELRSYLRFVVGQSAFDSVWIDRAYLGHVACSAGLHDIVVDVDDLESVQLEREQRLGWKGWHAYCELLKTRWYEKRLARRFRRVVVCKAEDARVFSGGRGDVHVVPNGVPDAPVSDPKLSEPGRMLFVGTLDYAPNADAIKWFATEILPRVQREFPAAKFIVAGRGPATAVSEVVQRDGVQLNIDVGDLKPLYDTASIVVAPLRLGSGTKLKVLEAFSRGRAVVGTDVAVEGISARNSREFLHANSADEFARACINLLNDEALREALASKARALVEGEYRWESIGRLAEAALLGG